MTDVHEHDTHEHEHDTAAGSVTDGDGARGLLQSVLVLVRDRSSLRVLVFVRHRSSIPLGIRRACACFDWFAQARRMQSPGSSVLGPRQGAVFAASLSREAAKTPPPRRLE